MHFLFNDVTWITNGIIPLTNLLLRHCTALRFLHDEEISVVNGKGMVAVCRVYRPNRHTFEFHVLNVYEQKPPADISLVVGILSNRDRMKAVVEKGTELGVRVFHFVNMQRSQKVRKIDVERLYKTAKAACSQSGQAYLPEINVHSSIDMLLESRPSDAINLIAEKDSTGQLPPLDGSRPVWLWVGPEGGFTETELGVLQSDSFLNISLGNYRLRSETAAIALASLTNHALLNGLQ